MIATCPQCKNHGRNKEVQNNTVICPKCKTKWQFNKRTVYILTGCSGVGKTCTGMALQKLTQDYVVLDADLFYNIMPHECEQDYFEQVEQILYLSADISQCGKSVVWTMAGNIDKLPHTYHARFFRDFKVLALTCTSAELQRRMTEGRGISDEEWLSSSQQYNAYFQTHSRIGDVTYDTLDISNLTQDEAAKAVLMWLQNNNERPTA